jgi:hypothetical protein
VAREFALSNSVVAGTRVGFEAPLHGAVQQIASEQAHNLVVGHERTLWRWHPQGGRDDV